MLSKFDKETKTCLVVFELLQFGWGTLLPKRSDFLFVLYVFFLFFVFACIIFCVS